MTTGLDCQEEIRMAAQTKVLKFRPQKVSADNGNRRTKKRAARRGTLVFIDLIASTGGGDSGHATRIRSAS